MQQPNKKLCGVARPVVAMVTRGTHFDLHFCEVTCLIMVLESRWCNWMVLTHGHWLNTMRTTPWISSNQT